ncbi:MULTISPECIES: carboxymuconolactone decarboxylase family protein [Paenarthrobacter]|uniref:carboxymuconolactone decarboxylase family protein n=1 Tax=Paenarthrobacter TaxID=1742992 RepID=UPI00074D45F4|nr:peroxidase-related enzyme [Paenarthrobacter ureafaciens]AMB40510.1 carboxymuconolactone decarboxylase [Arthrobacter sp. ATCC 21022]KUR63759.1 carboxymuconolactone decarboxylase [Arthrobacter sp. ATCC 21022]
MSILNVPSEAEATGRTADIYQSDLKSLGYVPSHTKAVSLNPEAYEAWASLARAIGSSLGLRRYELVTLAAAQAIGSSHCRLAHGKKTLAIIDEEELAAIARDYRTAGLPPEEVAMMDYAVKLSTEPSAMSDDDTLRLRDAGFSDREIVDITLAAAARNYFSRALLALAVDLDVPQGLSPGLKDALLAPLPPD